MKGFYVYKYSNGTKHVLFTADDEGEAKSFCVENGWELMDENGFVWGLDYEEG